MNGHIAMTAGQQNHWLGVHVKQEDALADCRNVLDGIPEIAGNNLDTKR